MVDLSQYTTEELQQMLSEMPPEQPQPYDESPEGFVIQEEQPDLSNYTTEELQQMLSEMPAEAPPQVPAEAPLQAPAPSPFAPSLPEATPLHKLGSAIYGAGDIATFGFLDEAVARLKAIDPNVTYEDALARVRETQEMAQRQAPRYYLGGQVTGGLAPLLAGGVQVPSLLRAGTSKLANLAKIAGAGAIGGVAYGAGAAEEDRLAAIPAGAGYGAVGGVAGTGIAKGIGAVGKRTVVPLARRAASLFKKPKREAPEQVLERIISKQEQVTPLDNGTETAYSKVRKSLEADVEATGEDYENVLNAYKAGDVSLAEVYGKRTKSLAKGAALYPSGRAITEEALDPKIMGAYERLLESTRKNISGLDNYYATVEDIVEVGRMKARPFYKQAYEELVDIKEPLPLEIRQAIKTARTKYPTDLEGLPDNSVEVLDYAKKELDDVISAAYRAGENNFASSRTEIKNNLLDIIDEQVPVYKTAREKGGDYLTLAKAMETGKNALKTDSELLGKTFKNLSEREKEGFKMGLGKAVREELGRIQEGANPYKRILGTPEKRKRLSSVLSPEEFRNFEKGLKAEDRLFKYRNEVLGGSPTAERLEAKNLISGGAVTSMFNIPKKIMVDSLSKIKTKYLDGMNDKVAGQVADILYETDPIKKLQIIDKLRGSKVFTQDEKLLVKRAYALAAEKYDSLSLPLSVGAGAITAGTMGE